MNQLFYSMYGKDALKYLYPKDKGTTIQEFDDPRNPAVAVRSQHLGS